MKTKKNLFLAAEICLYVGTFMWFFIAACAFALSDKLYYLYTALGILCICTGLCGSTIRARLTSEGFSDKDKKRFIACMVLSVAFFPATVLYAVGFFKNFADKEEVVAEQSASNELAAESPVKTEKPLFKKKSFIVSVICVCTVLFSCFSAMLFETSAFGVKVEDFTLTQEMTVKYNTEKLNGVSWVIQSPSLSYTVTEYKPKTASKENPAPVVFVMPGFTRTRTTMAQYAIEYSRRGAVVFVIDPGCQGGTTFSGYKEDGSMISSTVGANGLDYLVQYVYANTDKYDYVDRQRFGAVGHSAGGGNVADVAEEFAGYNYGDSVIKSVYISGYIKTSSANRYKNFRCNAGLSYAYYDEGEYRYQSDSSAFETIASRFVNEVYYSSANSAVPSKIYDVKEDYAYGNAEDGTYRIIHREKTNHCFEMYDALSITNSISFFTETLNFGKDISASSHTWFGKEFFNGLALVAAMTLVVSLAYFLMEIPFFKTIRTKRTKRVAAAYAEGNGEAVDNALANGTYSSLMLGKERKKPNAADKIVFWLSMIVSGVIACLDFIPLANVSIDMFPDAASNTFTFFFPARMVNAVLLWAVVNGLVGLAIFFGTVIIKNLVRKEKDWSQLEPLKINPVQLLKTLLLAAILFVAYYGLDHLCIAIFHEDFRFMLISASSIPPRYAVTVLMYLPLFFIFYIQNSIRVNCGIGFEGWKEWKVLLVGALANSLGLVFILVINYVCFFSTGSVFYGYMGAGNEVWLYINMVFPLVIMMALLPVMNRIIYKKTHNVWLSAIVCCAIFVTMTMTASVSYIAM